MVDCYERAASVSLLIKAFVQAAKRDDDVARELLFAILLIKAYVRAANVVAVVVGTAAAQNKRTLL